MEEKETIARKYLFECGQMFYLSGKFRSEDGNLGS